MPRSSYETTSFIGGEVSPLAQGRSDLPWYRQALSLSLNGVTVEEGAWVRRSGFEFIIPTRGRTYARILPFDGSATCSFGMIFTNDNLQFVTQSSVVFDNTIGTITASTNNGGSSIEITLAGAPSEAWNGGDQVFIVFPDVTSTLYPYPQALEIGLRNRLLTIGATLDTTHYTLANDLGINLVEDATFAGWVAGALVGAQIMRVLNISTTYSGVQTLQDLRAVQVEYQSIILSGGLAPQVVQITTEGSLTADPVFSFGALGMVDGPYLDPSGDTGTVTGLTGTVDFTAATTEPFESTDVGRHIRLFSQPALWLAATNYTVGQNVTDANGAWWTAIINSTGVVPGNPTLVSGVQQLAWAPAPTAGSWAWGKITAVLSGAEVTLTFDTTIPGMALQSSNGDTISSFQLGVYTLSGGSVFPTCGLWLQGRLWLAGAVPNRFDTTTSNGLALGIATFSPTDPYGNVLDDSGISEILNAPFVANIQWMTGEDAGVLMGTLNGEFLVFSSATNDPITPTNIDERMITKFGSQFIEPVHAGMSTIFAQKYGRRAIEYLADAFTGKFSGRHLNEWAKHLTVSGIARLAYQEEPYPCVRVLMNNGLLTGCTYRRFSRFVSEPANIAAWNRTVHGRQRVFTDMAVIPGKNGLLDRLFTITNDPAGINVPPFNNYFVEIEQPLFDEGMTAQEGWFCDEAPGPGPGNSGYDCGGGNAAIFGTTGGLIGSDSTTPSMSNTPPYSNNGATPAVGTDLSVALSALEASYFDGNTGLYMLPPFPLTGGAANETSLSLSVWVASEDFQQQAGALFSSPALSAAEAAVGNKNVSSMLSAGGNFASTSTGLGGYPYDDPIEFQDTGGLLPAGQVWNNVMISFKSNGNGTANCTVAINETVVISNATSGGSGISNNNPIWPFLAQPNTQKDLGLAVWCIGGTDVIFQDYEDTTTDSTVVPTPYTIPTLAQIIQSLFSTIPLGESLENPPPGILNSNIKFTSANLSAIPAYLTYITNLAAQQQSQQNTVVSIEPTSGGHGNLPGDQPLGGYAGYRGSVAELLIWPNKYIDWTNATNRGYLHYYDSVDNQYKPLSVGPTGSGTSLGAPWVYLSGPPSLFNVNRVTGVALPFSGTGMIESPLPPPGAP